MSPPKESRRRRDDVVGSTPTTARSDKQQVSRDQNDKGTPYRADLPGQVRAPIEKYRMLPKGEPVVAGVSGGPDSVALLHLLVSLRREFGISLYAAHLNHLARGRQSDADAAFVEQLATRWGVPSSSERIDVPGAVEREGGSFEEVAREARYAFFSRVCDRVGATTVAVGHTRDDQAETILMRMIRGAGPLGMQGMAPVVSREREGFRVVRPLLATWRSQIEAYLAHHRIRARSDPSNRETRYLRNRIRRELLPLLEARYNPRIKERLATLAEHLATDYAYVDCVAERAFRTVSRISDGQVCLDLHKLQRLPEAIRRQVVRRAIHRVQGSLRRLTTRHWRELEELIEARPGGSVVDLPRGLVAARQNGRSPGLLIGFRPGRAATV